MDSEEINVCDTSDDLSSFIETISEGQSRAKIDNFSEEINVCDIFDDLSTLMEPVGTNATHLKDVNGNFIKKVSDIEGASSSFSSQIHVSKSKKMTKKADKFRVKIAKKQAEAADSVALSDDESDLDSPIIK